MKTNKRLLALEISLPLQLQTIFILEPYYMIW